VHPWKATRSGLAAALWTAGSVLASAAEHGSFQVPSSGDGLHAGESLSVSWSLDAAALSERDEMELVLSLDGGATFPIRVTGELSTGARNLAWRVPVLPTQRAVLALRAGDGVDGESEAILAASELFTIAADPNAAPELLYEVAEDWRPRDALDGAPVRTTPRDLASSDGGPELSAFGGDADESETPPAGAEAIPPETVRSVAKAPRSVRRGAFRSLSTFAPLPLRI
jgi:hypothetical protein